MASTGLTQKVKNAQQFSFIPNAPFLPQKKHRITTRKVTPSISNFTQHTPKACQSSSSKKALPEFDRDYYGKLKEMYKDDPKVHILSRDDYELDPKTAPWLHEYRGRDIEEIRDNVRRRVEEYEKNKAQREEQGKNADPMEEEGDEDEDEDEDDGIPFHALRWTDLHTEQEIKELRESALTMDIANGRVWSCPMTMEELDLAEESDDGIHFRPDNDDAPSVFPTSNGMTEWGDSPSLEDMGISDVQDEAINALNESYRRMTSHGFFNTNPTGTTRDPPTWGESIPVAHPDEYKRWQREAEIRGGNAVVDAAQDFAPYTDVFQNEPVNTQPSAIAAPPQHDTLVNAYTGEWSGTATIIELTNSGNNSGKEKEANFNPKVQCIIPIQSDCMVKSEGIMKVETKLNINGKNICSDVPFSSPKFRNGISRDRAVSEDASYICTPTEHGDQALQFSMPPSTLIDLVSSPEEVRKTRPVIEIGLTRKVARENSHENHWHRIFLFTQGRALHADPFDDTEDIRKMPKDKFTHLVVLTQTKSTSGDVVTPQFQDVKRDLPSLSVRDLIGTWKGRALLLQPEYLPEGVRHVDTEGILKKVALRSIKEDDVTTVENKLEFPPGEESKRQQRQNAKRKVSARVKAARKHDEARLSKCSLIASDTIGDVSPRESHAWALSFGGEQDFGTGTERMTHMTSPRIGRFVDDYAGLAVVEDALWITFPYTRAFPSMWNVVMVTEISAPTRRRIVAGRSVKGVLVGGLFTNETVTEDEEG